MAELRAHFNAGDETALRGHTGPAGHLHSTAYILAQIDAPHGARVLDVGCGDGAVLAALKRLRPDLECEEIDFAEEARARAACGEGNGINFSVCDILQQPIELDTFDRVFSFSVAQYLSTENFASVCHRLRGGLRSEGRLAHLSVPDLRKRAILFHDTYLNELHSGLAATWLNVLRMHLVDLKRRFARDRAYALDSFFHDGEELAERCGEEYRTRVVRPSDSWYRFDLHLTPR